MDLLSQHEAFLRAIFDAPDDDTPRLVYADFLEENGESERASVMRWQCDPSGRTRPEPAASVWGQQHERGFREPRHSVAVRVELLADRSAFRKYLVHHPEWFAARSARLHEGRVRSGEAFDVLFSLAAFSRLTELVLVGEERRVDTPDGLPVVVPGLVTDSVIRPVIDTVGVEALARSRGMVRITSLDLRNNDLDNDAARAIVRSPYLDNLKRLRLLDGNRLRGKVWQQVIERFGEDVVG